MLCSRKPVLGPEKNLLLFKEMLCASGSPDVHLPHHLAHGFPLLGTIPPSGTLPLKPAQAPALTRDELVAEWKSIWSLRSYHIGLQNGKISKITKPVNYYDVTVIFSQPSVGYLF